MRNVRLFLILVVVAMAMAGCRTTKPGVSGGKGDWTNVTVPMKLVMQGEKGVSASGRLTMVRDESIYMSVRVLGMEMFSIYAEGDSAWVYDKMSGTLLCERLGRDPKNGKRLNIGRLQDILLGTRGTPEDFTIDAWKFRIECRGGEPVSTPYGDMRDGWNAVIENADMAGEVRWRLAEAKWNQDKVGEWRRPRSPKRVLDGSAALFKWLGLEE